MGKYDELVSEAKVAITDANVNALNASNLDCHLKMRKELYFLNDAIEKLAREKGGNRSVFGKFKDAMFETASDLDNAKLAKQTANSVAQLNYCLRCRCASCPIIDETCVCEGCVFGAHVVRCPGGNGVELRKVDHGVLKFEGKTAVSLEHDRRTRKNTVTVLDDNGVESTRPISLR